MTILRIQIGYQRFPELNLSFMLMLVRACRDKWRARYFQNRVKAPTMALKLNAPRSDATVSQHLSSCAILAELLDLPPMRWTAHSRQFARIVTRSGLRRGVRE